MNYETLLLPMSFLDLREFFNSHDIDAMQQQGL